MKTVIFKKSIRIITFCVLILATILIIKSTIKNIKHLYSSEKTTHTAMTCFTDLIY